jgi:hypothetical protein
MSILDLPNELPSNILNYLQLNSLIDADNDWNNHLISLHCGDEKILEFLLDNFKFVNFRLEALNITDALAQKLAKAWFVRFAYCTMAMKNIDILNQFHCYIAKRCFSLSNDNDNERDIDTKYTNNKRDMIHMFTNTICNENGSSRLISFLPKRKVCDKIGCERKYCKFLKNEIDKHKTFYKNIFPSFLDEIVVNIHEKDPKGGYSYKETIIIQRKCFKKLCVSEFATDNVVDNNFVNDFVNDENNDQHVDHYVVDQIVKPGTYLKQVDDLLFNNVDKI